MRKCSLNKKLLLNDQNIYMKITYRFSKILEIHLQRISFLVSLLAFNLQVFKIFAFPADTVVF